MSNQSIELRKPNPLDYADPNYGEILRQLYNNNQTSWIWDLLIKQQAPNDTAEIRVNFTDAFNGETTPIIIYVISVAATEDKAAGTGAQAVRVFGIDENGAPTYEDITLHAAAGTQIAGATKWKRLVGAMVITAGSGGVNADAITITNTGQAETYITIAAGENCSITARVWVPTDYSAFIGSLKAMLLIVSHGTAEVLYGVGAIVEPIYLKGTPTRLTIDEYWVGPDLGGMKDLGVYKELIVGANTYYISLKHVTKADDVNDTPIYNLKIIMYKQRIT